MFDKLARPGSQMQGIAEYRNQQFDQQFFNSLVQADETTGFHTDLSGNMTYTDTAERFPTLEEAWNTYRTAAQQRMIRPNYIKFQEGYKRVRQLKDQKQLQELTLASNAGATTKDFQTLAKNNPAFHKKLLMMTQSNPELAAQLAQYLPGKTLGQKIQDSPGYYTAAGIGTAAATAAGISALNTIPEATMADAKSAYRATTKGLRGEMNAAKSLVKEQQKKLNDLVAKRPRGENWTMKGDAKLEKSIKTAEKQLKKAQTELTKTQKNLAKGLKEGSKQFKRAAKTRYQSFKDSKWMKGGRGIAVRGGAYMAGPIILGKAAETITGDEQVGELTERSASAAIGAKLTHSTLMGVLKKKGAGFIFREVAKKKGTGFALKTLGKLVVGGVASGVSAGVLTGVMAAWTGKDIYEIMRIISEIE